MTRVAGLRRRQPAPGSRDDLRAWARLAPAGLLLLGAGACVTTDAAVRRGAGAPAPAWAGAGTVGLLLQGAGLSLFGEAVKRRALHDVRAERGAVRG